MGALRKRKWVSLTLLSIVVPMSLFATFRLTGILQGPVTISETTTLEAAKWEFQRPKQNVHIDDKLETLYVSEDLSVIMRVVMGAYYENEAVFGDSDWVSIGIKINSTATNGFIESVFVVFREEYKQSVVSWVHTEFHFKNLSLIDRAEAISGKEHIKALVRLAGINDPDSIFVLGAVLWELRSPNGQNHEMEVAFELTYYNGTGYKKIVQPFQLKIIGIEGE